MQQRSGKEFRWRDGNRYRLLVDGPDFFPAMLAAIGQAQQTVFLELYLIESGVVAGRFITALGAAAARGVTVCLLLDDYGASRLSAQDRQQLRNAGVALAFYNPLRYGRWRRNLFRDHRKLLTVDGEVAFVGGAGITDAFADEATELPWHDVMLEVRGPCVADWQTLFRDNWVRWAEQPLRFAPPPDPADGRPGRVALNAPAHMEIRRSLLKRIRGAERRVWIATAYFIPSLKLRRALRRAAGRGVDVRLLLPGDHTDHPAIRHAGRRYYARLLNSGVRIFEFQPRFLHAKVLLCDSWISIGSSNIDRWNLSWNLEANQEADDQQLTEAVERLFARDFRQSTECLPAEWRQRPWFRRLLEQFWGYVEIWLAQRANARSRRDLEP
jgi:cardiolipin synthase